MSVELSRTSVMKMPLEERLLTNSVLEDRGYESLCRVWLRSAGTGGYGMIRVSGKTLRTHRVAYEVWVGEIPAGLNINHHCDQVDCLEPTHLYAGTQVENVRDRGERGRTRTGNGNVGKTHCKYGHEFTPENTYIRPGHRHCRECALVAAADQRRRRREARYVTGD